MKRKETTLSINSHFICNVTDIKGVPSLGIEKSSIGLLTDFPDSVEIKGTANVLDISKIFAREVDVVIDFPTETMRAKMKAKALITGITTDTNLTTKLLDIKVSFTVTNAPRLKLYK